MNNLFFSMHVPCRSFINLWCSTIRCEWDSELFWRFNRLSLPNCNFVSECHTSSCAELKYNITADVHHKDGFPSRFYFSGNGTSNVTAGRVKAKHEQLTCATHQAFMKVRDSVYIHYLCWRMLLLTLSHYDFSPKQITLHFMAMAVELCIVFFCLL